MEYRWNEGEFAVSVLLWLNGFLWKGYPNKYTWEIMDQNRGLLAMGEHEDKEQARRDCEKTMDDAMGLIVKDPDMSLEAIREYLKLDKCTWCDEEHRGGPENCNETSECHKRCTCPKEWRCQLVGPHETHQTPCCSWKGD